MGYFFAFVSLFALLASGRAAADPSDYDVSPSNGTATSGDSAQPVENSSGTETGNILEKAKKDAEDLGKAYEEKVDGLKEKVKDKLEIRTPSAVTSVRG